MMNGNYEKQKSPSTDISSRLSRRGLLGAGTVLGVFAALGPPTTASAVDLTTDTNYTPDDNVDLRNPERGFYRQPEPFDPPGSHTLVEGWLWLHKYCNTELVWNGLDVAGTSPVLNEYAKFLQGCRAKGVKAVFRPRYDNPSGNTPSACGLFHADRLDRQLRHIDAVGKMVFANRDAIGVIQAGYLGRWGEWNTDGYPDATAPFLYRNADRIAITERILLAYSGGNPGKLGQPVELRRPVFAQEVLDRNARANVGLYNDCFMTNAHDFGTYLNFNGSSVLNLPGSPANLPRLANETSGAYQERQRNHWFQRAQQISETTSFGGETCYIVRPGNPGYPGTERWRSCANMRNEPAALHVNYLNRDYAEDAVGAWTAGGCLPEIQRRLGYRFEVTKVAYTRTVSAGQNFMVTIGVKNTGWARLHKPRRAQLFLRKASTSWTTPLGYAATDSAGLTRNWAAGATIPVTYTAVAPAAGTYSLHLALFDTDAPVIWNQPPPSPSPKWAYDYAVKLASKRGGVNIFNTSTGMNDLGILITVQ